MLKKAVPFFWIILLAVILVAIRQCKHKTALSSADKQSRFSGSRSSQTINRDRGFDRRISFLEYSRHAQCRMECRHISQAEVEEIMQTGKINYKKSELKTTRCPRYALEGITKDNQRVRIVFAQCNEKTEVVTVIDLDTDWSCQCAGNEKQ